MSARLGRSLRSGRYRVAVALALGAALGLVAFGGLQAGIFKGYQLQASDSLQPTGTTDERILVVAIDRRSLASVEARWPWPRNVHAELTRQLAGAEVILYDILFSAATAEDKEFAGAIGSTRNVALSATAELNAPRGSKLYVASGLTTPARTLAEHGEIAHSNVTPDPADGVVRSLPLLVETKDGEFLPSLSLAVFARAEELEGPFTVRPSSLVLGSVAIPTGPRAVLDIAFSSELQIGARKAPIVSAVDVIEGRIPRERIDGRIILIGATEPSLGDDRATPVAKGQEMPGVLVHANALNTMLTGGYLQPASHSRTALAAGALAGVVALATLLLPVSVAPFAAFSALGGYIFWAALQFDGGRVLDLIYPNLTILFAFIAALAFRYFTELRGRRRASLLFSQYVPRGVANALLDSGRLADAIMGERLEVTALFCDLRGFTATSAKLEPGQVRDLLNLYYDETGRLVLDHDGTLLTYVGDEVFAAWGAPMPDARGASKAVACARSMQDARKRLNERLAEQGLPAISYGIGLHTGEVIAAHVGSVHRQYTIIGNTVNCASRLCTIAGRNEIVVSSETYGSLEEKPPAFALPGIRLKGVGRDLLPQRLWPDELRDPTGEERMGKVEV